MKSQMCSHSEILLLGHIQMPLCSCHSFVRVSLIPSSWLCFSWKKVYPGPGRYPSCSSTHTLKMLLLLWYWFLPWPPSRVKSPAPAAIIRTPAILFTRCSSKWQACTCSPVASGQLAAAQHSPGQSRPRLSTSCKKLPRQYC